TVQSTTRNNYFSSRDAPPSWWRVFQSPIESSAPNKPLLFAFRREFRARSTSPQLERVTMLTAVPSESQLQFAQFPMKRSWRAIRDNIPNLRGASVVLFVGSDYDSWLIFTYNGHQFSINNEDAVLKFRVQDGGCPP